jgi:cytidine deaminase
LTKTLLINTTSINKKIKKITIFKMTPLELIKEAVKAKEYSYSPYSKFRVGAALLTKDGQVFSGCNVENASYGGAICAERTAVVKAVSQGYKEFESIAVVTDVDDYISPCGFCRQFMNEFGNELKVYMAKAKSDDYKTKLLCELLPDSFGPQNLL